MPKPIHEGRNVKCIREILGIKQDTLAMDLGLSQQSISQLEQKETIDKDLLEKVAKSLGVSPEAIKNFNEQAAINNINNTYENSSVTMFSYQFNLIEKIVDLYEALLKAEREKCALLEKLLQERK